MKQLLTFVCIVFSSACALSVFAEAQTVAQPERVREVLAGQRDKARVSWWGFDEKDSTEFLQRAINSKVRKLIIDRQKTAWITKPLKGVSDQEIILEAGVEVVALRGAFRGQGDCLLSFAECENVVVRGEKRDGGAMAHFRMQKQDYQSSGYDKSEWRHGLSFAGCRNVLIQDLTIEQTGGDGIYLGASWAKGPNREITIRRVDCNDNHRQGISVISAENLLIEGCHLRNTRGTEPQSGIDFEPNSPKDLLVNCVVRNCMAENNAGTGFQVCPQFMNSQSRPISLLLDRCTSRSNRQHAVHLCSAPKDPPGGRLRIVRLRSEGDSMAGLSVQFNPFDAIRVDLADSVICDSAREETFFPPLYVQGIGVAERPPGNIHFKNLTIIDDVDRPCLKIRDGKTTVVKDVTGDLVLERNGRRQLITVDDAWLEEISRASAKAESGRK